MVKELLSKNQTIIVTSDSHQNWRKLNHIIEKENYDYFIHLGDFFDSHICDTKEDVEGICNLIKKYFLKPNFITLFGNHDLPQFYFRQNPYTYCSGYTPQKNNQINGILGSAKSEIRDKFQWYLYIDNRLFTHAGLAQYHLKPNHNLSKEYMINWLDGEIKKAKIDLESGAPNWVYNAGFARGGDYPKGGLVWADTTELDLIDGLTQGSGHNPGKCVRSHPEEGVLDPNDMQHIFIDCFLKEYLVINNGKITVKKYVDL